LLGLPCGVEIGSTKVFLIGVLGRASIEALVSLEPCDEGNMLEIKLAIVDTVYCIDF
jgi:hypothetical protein